MLVGASTDLSVLLDHIASDDVFNRHVDTARAWVAGFSLGGYTALAALGAITDMERFRAWAGDSPLARGPREFPDLADRLPDLLRTSAVFRSSWERQSASYGDERLTAALLLAPAPPVRAFTQTGLAEIAAPVHVMIGGADREAPAEVGAFWLAERCADARCTI